MSKQHKHFRHMADYAQDAAETDKPWERWEMSGGNESKWRQNKTHPTWAENLEYRRKPKKKAVDLSVLIRSGVDCEFADNPEFKVPTVEFLNSTSGRIKKYGSSVHSCFQYCRPRMNHWHYWDGGECPLPEGVLVEVKDGLGGWGRCRSTSLGIWVNPIAFKVIGLQEGYCWPWELD